LHINFEFKRAAFIRWVIDVHRVTTIIKIMIGTHTSDAIDTGKVIYWTHTTCDMTAFIDLILGFKKGGLSHITGMCIDVEVNMIVRMII